MNKQLVENKLENNRSNVPENTSSTFTMESEHTGNKMADPDENLEKMSEGNVLPKMVEGNSGETQMMQEESSDQTLGFSVNNERTIEIIVTGKVKYAEIRDMKKNLALIDTIIFPEESTTQTYVSPAAIKSDGTYYIGLYDKNKKPVGQRLLKVTKGDLITVKTYTEAQYEKKAALEYKNQLTEKYASKIENLDTEKFTDEVMDKIASIAMAEGPNGPQSKIAQIYITLFQNKDEAGLKASTEYSAKKPSYKLYMYLLGHTEYGNDAISSAHWMYAHGHTIKAYADSDYFATLDYKKQLEDVRELVGNMITQPALIDRLGWTGQGSLDDINRTDATWQPARQYYYLQHYEIYGLNKNMPDFIEKLSTAKGNLTFIFDRKAINAYFKDHPADLPSKVDSYNRATLADFNQEEGKWPKLRQYYLWQQEESKKLEDIVTKSGSMFNYDEGKILLYMKTQTLPATVKKV